MPPQDREQQDREARGGFPAIPVRLILRFGRVARTVGTAAAFFANPASLAIIVPIGIFVLALFLLLFATGAGFPGAPPIPGVPGTPSPIVSPVQPTQPIITAVASCPVSSGRITTSSFEGGKFAKPSGELDSTGHCGGGYAYACNCGTQGRRAKAIDVALDGKGVRLPIISGQPVIWRLVIGGTDYPISGGEGGGYGYIFETTFGGDRWYIDFVHMTLNPSIRYGTNYLSETSIGTPVIGHVHTTIGKNIANPRNPGSTATDCDPGWIPSDFMCK